MRIEFYEKELFKIREKFNQTFGEQTVCNLKTRCQVILWIIRMGLLHRKINKVACMKDARGEIQMFDKTKNALNTVFSEAEKCWGERGRDDKSNQGDRRDNQSSIAR